MINSLMSFLVAFLLATSLSSGQSQAQQSKETANWDAFHFLLGDWVGEGADAPGEAAGGFSFSFDLEGKVLVRRNRADYPATKNRPAFSHTDLMVIYHEPDGQTVRAIYFDNEGHVIHYGVSMAQDQTALTFLSDPSPSAPRFRFTYNKAKNDRMTFRFDIAPPGKPEAFSKYLEGSLRRK
ncbi:MAG: hypothetical protein DMF60_06790 [Acidobacteria bacterium]|nr:MAG: hypothetical protein DMF60_06790 [Acidobacteriota bacterium]